MQFDSFHFFIFFVVVCAAFWSIPNRIRWLLLLVASYYFYMCWEPGYALLLLASTIIDYCVGLLLGRVADPKLRRRLIFPSLMANLGFLFYFKYTTFSRGRSISAGARRSCLPSPSCCRRAFRFTRSKR